MRSMRYSVVGLMAMVLVAGLAFAAIRSGSAGWATAVSFVTAGIIILATVGALCRQGEEKAWWIGFAIFGWFYLLTAFGRGFFVIYRNPMFGVLFYLRSKLSDPAPDELFGQNDYLWHICNCIACLGVAFLGGYLSWFLFGTSVGAERAQPVPRRRPRWPAVWLVVLIVVASIAFVFFIRSPRRWADLGFMLTWGILGLMLVAAIAGKGTRRVMGLGGALFGIGYMILIFENGASDPRNHPLSGLSWPHVAADEILYSLTAFLPDYIRELPPSMEDRADANSVARIALNEHLPLHFPNPTRLEDALKRIRSDVGERFLIYVDPDALAQAEQTLSSGVAIDMEGVPLRTSLRLLLRQLGLGYYLKDGVLVIVSKYDEDESPQNYDTPYLIVAHCFLALFASLVGAFLAPFAAGRNSTDS